MTDLKQAFKVALARNNTTATAMADQLGLNRKTLYSAFYTGNPRFTTLERVASHLNMKVSEFIALGEM